MSGFHQNDGHADDAEETPPAEECGDAAREPQVEASMRIGLRTQRCVEGGGQEHQPHFDFVAAQNGVLCQRRFEQALVQVLQEALIDAAQVENEHARQRRGDGDDAPKNDQEAIWLGIGSECAHD